MLIGFCISSFRIFYLFLFLPFFFSSMCSGSLCSGSFAKFVTQVGSGLITLSIVGAALRAAQVAHFVSEKIIALIYQTP